MGIKEKVETPKFSGIYGIRNIVNGKIYIGQSYNIHKRWIEHRYELNNNIHHNQKLQNAWNKYEEDNFYFFVIEKCGQDIINEREIFWIDYYSSTDRDCGYNLSTGGENSFQGCSWSDEQKENASRKRNPKKVVQVDIYGNIIEIWRSASYASRVLNMRCSSIKRCCEHKAAQCNNYLWFYENDPLLRSKHKIKKFVMEHSSSINIPILQYDLYGELIKKFYSFKDISNEFKRNIIEIRECCNHKRQTSKGYIWLFELDDFELSDDYLLKCRISSGLYAVEQYDLEGNYIAEYNRENLPTEYGLDVIRANCNNICKTAYGFIWKYKGDNRKVITKKYIIDNDIFGKNKNVYVYENNELIKSYNSLKDAVADGYSASEIRNCCNGKIKTYKGMIWRYREVS